ncbi:MAG: shikimate dehydrogenase [Planctomycetota bacterium]
MICISVNGASTWELLKNLRSASRLSDCIEIRTDNARNFSLPTLLNQKVITTIFTCHSKLSGGAFSGTENERLKLLSSAIASGKFEYVTIDILNSFKPPAYLKSLLDLARIKNTKVILSYHNFKDTNDDLETIYQRLKLFKPAVIKIVIYAQSIRDNFKIFDFAQKITSQNKSKNPKLIAFCMGENGLISRILYKKFGLFLTYASYKENMETAEGQISFGDMKYIYRADSLNHKTIIFGLLGYPINHSFSPLLFNHLFNIRRLNAVYLPFAVTPQHFTKDFSLINDFLKPNGYSVTSPYKISVLKLLDKVDGTAREINAVNTICRKGNKLIGINTDWIGALESLSPIRKSLKNRHALILGKGGASSAILYALKRLNIKSTVFARHTNETGIIKPWNKLSQYCQGTGKNIILINTTPVGMFPNDANKSPIKESLIKKGMVVFDVVYNPIETKLLRIAKQKGCQVIDGMQMFISQAMEQFRYFTQHITYRDELLKK